MEWYSASGVCGSAQGKDVSERKKKKGSRKTAENGIRLCLRPGKYFCENGDLGKVGRQGHRCCTKRLRRYPGPD